MFEVVGQGLLASPMACRLSGNCSSHLNVAEVVGDSCGNDAALSKSCGIEPCCGQSREIARSSAIQKWRASLDDST